MSVVLFEPHHDDGVLFASYTLLDYPPRDVVTVFGEATSQKQWGITARQRRKESDEALMEVLGVRSYKEWMFSDVDPKYDDLLAKMRYYDDQDGPREVWVPLVEEVDGHLQHDMVGGAGREVFGDRCRFYATYRRGSGRTRTENEVIPEKGLYALKFKAMSCYTSQINLDNCRPWFNNWEREWTA